jgi:thiamine biosynthesis protein ThiS
LSVKTTIQFNGLPREVSAGATVAALLAELELRPAYVAVEINQELIPRGRHGERVLQPGDQVEVVTLVGGG